MARRILDQNNVGNLNVIDPLESRQPRAEKAAWEFMEAVNDEVRLT